MAFALKDRIQETTTTTGTGTITLAGAVAGFQSFAAVGNGNTTYYCITSGSAWEVGLGTYSTTGPTLARTTIYSNSLGTTAAISLTGTSNVFVTLPAQQIPGNGKFLQWQSVQTSNFTAVNGYAYPVNTTSAAITVTLPASPNIGDVVTIVDYAGTAGTNFITINRNGSNIEGSALNTAIRIARQALNFVYIDATQGWVSYAQQYVTAAPISYLMSYLIVAGGGGGGGSSTNGGGCGGGGAGGYLYDSTGTLTVGTTYTATVGAGGVGGLGITPPTAGDNSTLTGGTLSLTAAVGGGRGGYWSNPTTSQAATSGGSGGGGAGTATVGSGTSGQGFAGGAGSTVATKYGGGGGGGATAVGAAGNGTTGGNGGAGFSNTITGSSLFYAGGGGGGTQDNGTAGTGGSGVGGTGSSSNVVASDGAINTGSGGGGGGCTVPLAGSGGSGGKGVVILSIPTYIYSGVTTGSPTVTTSGSYTILTFTSSGTYTA